MGHGQGMLVYNNLADFWQGMWWRDMQHGLQIYTICRCKCLRCQVRAESENRSSAGKLSLCVTPISPSSDNTDDPENRTANANPKSLKGEISSFGSRGCITIIKSTEKDPDK